MTDRVSICTQLHGREPRYGLLVDGRKVSDLSYYDVADLAMKGAEALREFRALNVGGVQLDIVETITLGMKAMSCLRFWPRPEAG